MPDIIDGGTPFSTFEDQQFSGYSPAQKKASDVARAVMRQFGDESGVQLEDADLLRWVNDAQVTIVTANKVLKAKATVSTIANQSEYKYPLEDIHQIETVMYNGTRLDNLPFSQAQYLLHQHPSESAEHPSYWYEWSGAISLYPVPSVAGQLTIFYTRAPEPLTALTDTLSLPDKYFPLVVQYALAQAYEMDEDYAAAKMKQDQLDTNLTQMFDDERESENLTYPTIIVID